jgi:hypothetical protein
MMMTTLWWWWGWDDHGHTVTGRMLVSTASPVRGNNQLMATVGGGGDERGGRFWGMGRQKRVQVVVASQWSHWNWRSVQANIEYLYIRSYGETASVTSNLRVYSRT